MGGLLKRNAAEWEHIKALETQVVGLTETIANLQQEVASLRGRVRACENTGASANARCERVETRLGKLEHQVALPDVVERRFAPGDEDAEQPVKYKTCPTCRGTGSDAPEKPLHVPHGLCSSCEGHGYIEVAP